MDGDGSYNPTAILEMKSMIENYDAIFSSRYKGGAKSPDDTFIRAIETNYLPYWFKYLNANFRCIVLSII